MTFFRDREQHYNLDTYFTGFRLGKVGLEFLWQDVSRHAMQLFNIFINLLRMLVEVSLNLGIFCDFIFILQFCMHTLYNITRVLNWSHYS